MHNAPTQSAPQKLHWREYLDLTNSLTQALASIDTDVTQPIAMAQRLRISKQAVGQLVDELVSKGYVTRSPDPRDRLATRVQFTEKGVQVLQAAYHVKREIEEEYAHLIGEEGLAQVRSLLEKLI